MKNIKTIFSYVVVAALISGLILSCKNEDKTGGDTGGNSGNSGTEIGGNTSGGSGSASGGSGKTEILTPEEGTYDIDYSDNYHDIIITVKTNEDSTVQLSGNSSSINYKNYAKATRDYNCKTSNWTKEAGTDYKISKNIEANSSYFEDSTAEAKWRYFYSNNIKYIELDLNYLSPGG